jgi:hypothetical protein
LGDVVEWNRAFFGDLNGQPLEDERVDLKTGDIFELISRSKSGFDAILLDVDNGPDAMTDSGNRRLYSREGIGACRRALRKQGSLAVWSAEPSKKFEQRLMGPIPGSRLQREQIVVTFCMGRCRGQDDSPARRRRAAPASQETVAGRS